MSSTLVVGHRHPDNDSICSAVAYAYFKNITDTEGEYRACRLGPMPDETAWLFERYGIEVPALITSVRNRVADAMSTNIASVHLDETMLEAGRLIRQTDSRALVVIDDAGCYLGVLSQRVFANLLIDAILAADEHAKGPLVMPDASDPVARHIDRKVPIFSPDMPLKEAADTLLHSTFRRAAVLDDEGRCIGLFTRSDIAACPRRRVILVDHNEITQAAPGIQEAQVVEIVDHHRIGDIQTAAPARFLGQPVGATATIVTQQFEHNHVGIPPRIAAALLSAIMTDTVLLKSPTTTQVDIEAADYLGVTLGVDAREFGLELYRRRGDDRTVDISAMVGADAKEYLLGEGEILISQYETVDPDAVLARKGEIVKHLDELVLLQGYEFALLLVTDLLREGSYFIASGNTHIVERTFDLRMSEEDAVWVPGILSRKKQVAARLLEQDAW